MTTIQNNQIKKLDLVQQIILGLVETKYIMKKGELNTLLFHFRYLFHDGSWR